ncbi:MAG: bifunctional UDP-N-acetylglucosamine diphosphorylase/glucosamine-1-phosphate N-acetyltransferase GlmU [Bauldia litoralis]
MTSTPVSAVILAAGKGTRMKSALPKVLHAVGGRPMVLHVLDAVARIGAARSVVVIGPDMEGDVAPAVAPALTAIQHAQAGTADAVKAARDEMAGVSGTVLILYGDTPLITPETLSAMVAAREAGGHAVVVLGFRPEDPGPYGRLVTEDGGLNEIVEAKDASPAQLEIGLCNSGVMAVDGAILFDLLDRVGNDNAKGEYYLTDIVALARQSERSCGIVEADADELMGVNDRADLAVAESVFQSRRRAAAMAAGVTLRDPSSVYFSWDTELGSDVTVEPHVVFGPGVTVADGAEIRAYSHLEGAAVGPNAQVGPFARLRPGAKLGAKSRVGNFVEVKNAVLGEGAKANHLTYLGDAEIGAGANIGAGTITCNYDGFLKSKTIIGKGAFIGSNSALVAPVTIGAGAIVGAGSTITRDVAEDALGVERSEQVEVPRAAARFREKKAAEKAKQKKQE